MGARIKQFLLHSFFVSLKAHIQTNTQKTDKNCVENNELSLHVYIILISFQASLHDEHVSSRMRSCSVVTNKLCPTNFHRPRTNWDNPELLNNTHLPFAFDESHLSVLIPGLNQRKPNWIKKWNASSCKINPHFHIKLFWEVVTIVRLNLCVGEADIC